MRRLFVGSESIQGDRIHITDKDDIFYLSTVLRMKVGDGLFVLSEQEKAFEARIVETGRDGILLDIAREVPIDKDFGTFVTLFQGLPKGAKMDEIVRKSTELGVSRIVPVVTSRSVTGADGVSAAKEGRWRRIAEEAARQSRRVRVPEVADVLLFDDAASGLAAGGFDLIIVLFELEEECTLKRALRECRDRLAGPDGNAAPNVAVFIGPEGGFESKEIERLIGEGAESVTIGETILRTETAGPAAVAIILYEYEL